MSRLTILSTAVMTAIIAVFTSIAFASPNADSKASAKDGWITFGPDYPLSNLVTYVQQGIKHPDGRCEFSGELVLPLGSQAIEERETAINLTTCQVRIERGVPPANVTANETISPQGLTKSGEQKSTSKSTTKASSGEVSIAATAQRSAGLHRIWWEDPAHIDVNLVENNTDWHWNGNSVVGPVYGGYRYWWLSESGWTLRENNWQNYYDSYQSTSSSYAHFVNNYFCTATYGQYQPPTHTYYDRNTVNGRYNGDLVGSWRSWVDGGCPYFLHRHSQLVRSLN